MTLQGSQRRGFRRRMLHASGAGGRETGEAIPQPRPDRSTPYSKEARPENHPALATWLPTRTFHLWAACLGILLPVAALVGVATTMDQWLPTNAGRWAESVERARGCLSLSPRAGMAAWLGQFSLVTAGGVAVSIRQMRRYRLDDYRGRYRAWGWLAGLAILATVERQLPLSELVSAVVANATGIVPGPAAIGWWLCLSVPACLAVVLWAVVPMHERLGTGLAIVSTGLAWIGAAACGWMSPDDAGGLMAQLSGCLTLTGDGLFAVSMLIAARSVLREVRGEAAKPARQPPAEPRRAERSESPEEPVHSRAAETVATHWSDGSDLDENGDDWDENATRKLSKAERKRLRKLGGMNRAA